MNDRLDGWLARLPIEPPAPDLAVRIISAVAERRRARRMWQRVMGAALTSAFAGVALVALSWPEVTAAFAAIPAAPEATTFALAFDGFFAAPLEAFAALVDATLVWESALAEGVGAALMLGIVLLAVAAFGVLAQLLHRAAPLNDHAMRH